MIAKQNKLNHISIFFLLADVLHVRPQILPTIFQIEYDTQDQTSLTHVCSSINGGKQRTLRFYETSGLCTSLVLQVFL